VLVNYANIIRDAWSAKHKTLILNLFVLEDSQFLELYGYEDAR
jgi:hypothetical protein